MQQMQDDPRTRVQLDAILAWIESEKKGTVVLAPGFGKTRVGCIVVGEQLRKGKIKNALVVVPRIPLIEQ